jgi:thiamine-phosphate pyrophosphorylase
MIIGITHPTFLVNEAFCINALFHAGIDYLHIRKPNALDCDVERLINLIHQDYKCRLTVHYHHSLAINLGVGGLHRSQGFDIPDVNGYRLSAGCHSVKELREEKSGGDYLFLSPIFNSISKQGYASGFLKEELCTLFNNRDDVKSKIVALGGIDASNLTEAKLMGFDGAALLGGLWCVKGNKIDVDTTVKQFNRIKNVWKNLIF